MLFFCHCNPIFSMVHFTLLRSLSLGRLSMIISKASTIWLRNFSGPIGCHGRTASYLTAPAQIPACGTTALGSSEILASVKDKLVSMQHLVWVVGQTLPNKDFHPVRNIELLGALPGKATELLTLNNGSLLCFTC